MTKFLNFHTHHLLPHSNEKRIYNLLIQHIDSFEKLNNSWVSVGIHPWYADAGHWEEQLQKVEESAMNENVLAIGECGLDRLIALPLDTQMSIFNAQVTLAEKLGKPVIIHCVRAFNELIQWKKQTKPTVPLIVHGFNNKPEIAQQLLVQGFYFSLGSALLNPVSNASKVIKRIPIERLFLENDDRDTPIKMVYEVAATHLEMTISDLKNQIWANFATVFKR